MKNSVLLVEALRSVMNAARERAAYAIGKAKVARGAVLCAWNGHIPDEGGDSDGGQAFQEFTDDVKELTGNAGISYQLEACLRCGEVYVGNIADVTTKEEREFVARPPSTGLH